MCNTVYCGLINININTDVQENVQIGCTGYVHIAAVWMMENNGCVYSLLNWVLWMLWCYDAMRLSLGAWWPGGRNSSSVSQFLPSCSWSACQMAVKCKKWLPGWFESLMILAAHVYTHEYTCEYTCASSLIASSVSFLTPKMAGWSPFQSLEERGKKEA